MQLAANKDQLQTISLELEKRDREIARLTAEMKRVEKQLAGSLHGLLVTPDNASYAEVSTLFSVVVLLREPKFVLASEFW